MIDPGTAIEVVGYGALTGQTERVKIGSYLSGKVVLVFHDPTTGEDTEVPFRLVDGNHVGSSPEGGFNIPAPTRKKMQEPTLTVVKGGKSETASKTQAATAKTPAPTAGKVRRKVATATATPPATGTGKKKNTAAVAAPVAEPVKKKTATPATTPANAAANGKAKTTPPAMQGPAGDARKNGKTAPAAAATEDAEQSPMTRRTRKPAEGEVVIKLAPLMYRQIAWDEIRPLENAPAGTKIPAGWKAFKKAWDEAAERSYVFIIVNEAAAKFLVSRVFKNGFGGKWSGSLDGGFKRAAKRVSEQLAEEFPEIEIPAVIANHVGSGTTGAKDEEEEEPTPEPKKRGRAAAAPVTPPTPPATGKRKAAPAPAPEPEPTPAAKKKTAATTPAAPVRRKVTTAK